MTTEIEDDARRAMLERRRMLITRRLMPLIRSLERKREAAVQLAEDVIPSLGPSHGVGRRPLAALALAGAAVGCAAVAAAWLLRRRRGRRTPLGRVTRAIERYTAPLRPPSFARLVAGAVGTLALTAINELVRAAVQRSVEAGDAALDPAAPTPTDDGADEPFVIIE